MKKLLIGLILTIILAITPAMAANWTIMIYMDGDNNLESYAIQNFLELASVGSTPDVNIVVLLDRAVGYDSSYGDWTTAKLFYVKQGITPDASNALDDWGEVNMGDPQTLIRFVNWSVNRYPAKHYALILWDHGWGWKKRIMRGVIFDDTNEDYLNYSELLYAISAIKSKIGRDLDIIGFDACLMGMEEIDYAINASMPTAIRVGSEEVEPALGWPYDRILQNLTANPSMSPEELAIEIVNDYSSLYQNNPYFGPIYTLSAVYVNNTIEEALDDFVNAVMGSNDILSVAFARANVESFRESIYLTFVDLYNLTELIAQFSGNQTVINKAKTLMDAINSSVIIERHGPSHSNVHGVSIYFPATKLEYDTEYVVFGPYNETKFAKDTLWNEFLEWFYRGQNSTYLLIDRPGNYILPEDIGNQYYYGIIIASSDVTLEGNGHVINGSDVGIWIGSTMGSTIQNITIKNVTIKDNTYGIAIGYALQPTCKIYNVVIENCVIENSYYCSIVLGDVDGLLIRNCTISNGSIVTGLLVTTNNIVITDCKLNRSTMAFGYVNNLTIINNTVSNGLIYFVSCSYTMVSKNRIYDVADNAIYCESLMNGNISDNIIYNVTDGIHCELGENLAITNNVIYDTSEYGISLVAVEDAYVSDNDIYSCGGGIMINVGIDNIGIAYNAIHNNDIGIFAFMMNNSSIVENSLYGNSYCNINVSGCNNLTIAHNEISGGIEGIKAEINNSYIVQNIVHDIFRGIFLMNSNYNHISENDIYNFSNAGITLSGSNDNLLYGNTIRDGGYHGIEIINCIGTQIINNTVVNMTRDCIGFSGSYVNNTLVYLNTFRDSNVGIDVYANPFINNSIYLNNFINNTNHMFINENVTTIGNHYNTTVKFRYVYGSKVFESYLGNYWDNHTEPDSDNDGIVDDPYVINDENVDYYPLKLTAFYYIQQQNPPKIENFVAYPSVVNITSPLNVEADVIDTDLKIVRIGIADLSDHLVLSVVCNETGIPGHYSLGPFPGPWNCYAIYLNDEPITVVMNQSIPKRLFVPAYYRNSTLDWTMASLALNYSTLEVEWIWLNISGNWIPTKPSEGKVKIVLSKITSDYRIYTENGSTLDVKSLKFERRIVKDGRYLVYISAEDFAGNKASNRTTVIVNNSNVALPPLPGHVRVPKDIDGDGVLDDFNGNGILDFNDVVVFYKNMDWIRQNYPISRVDQNGDNRLDFNDVIKLFRKI